MAESKEMFPVLQSLPLLPVACTSLLVYLIVSYALSYRRLGHIPGPVLARFSYLWMFRVWSRKRQSAIYSNINKTYGSPLARIGPIDLITDSPDLIRRMSSARSNYTRSSWYVAVRMDPYDDSLFSMLDVGAHDKLKAKMTAGYGGKEVPKLEEDIDGQVNGLVDLIRRKYLSVGSVLRPMEFARASQLFTLDAITKVAYGREFGYMATEDDIHGYMKATEDHVPLITLSAEIPFFGRLFLSPWVWKLIGAKKTDKKGMGKVLSAAANVVSQRFAPDAKDQWDMLSSFVRHGVTQRQCETEVPFQIVAGSDTTATTIRATMLYLTSARQAYDRLQKEIDKAIAEGLVSSPIKTEEGKRLEYLQAVIYEGLRMQIPFSGLIMKQAPPEGDTFDGIFIPGGTRIAHNTLAVQRSTATFGQDAEMFRPERWLEAAPEKHKEMTQVVELVFGYGRWMCAGKSVAFMELNKVYVELLRNFDFQLINPLHPWDEINSNMFWHFNLWMKVTERKF